MSGPLDDAMGKQDKDRQQLKRQLRDNHVKMQDLILDFLRRMHAAGDPGTRNMNKNFSQEWPVIPRLGWELAVTGARLKIFRTGKVVVTPPFYYGPLEKADLGQVGFHYEEIVQEMARILRENGVRLCTEPQDRH
jgi:hypothetical protein